MGETPGPTPPDVNAGQQKPATPGPVLSREETLRRFFIGRLVHLKQLDDISSLTLGANDQRMVRKALYSTYLDAVNVGAGEEAKTLLKLDAHTESPQGPTEPTQIFSASDHPEH